MKYGILQNGVPVPAPNPLRGAGVQIYNPPDWQYAEAGYLPIVETPYPAGGDGEERVYYEALWQEREGRIVRIWQAAQAPEIPPTVPTLEQRMTAVEGSTAALSADLELLLSGATEEVAADET